jgi:hypothetical protein
MELASLLKQNRKSILDRWFDLVIQTYPRDSAEFLTRQKDPFRNPVGHAIVQGLGPIYDQIVAGLDPDRLRDALDRIIRIRSVQEFTPSEAVGFVFQLKTVIRDVLGDRIPGEIHDGSGSGAAGEAAEIASRIDAVALLAFEKYVECRETLHEIRCREIRNRSTSRQERQCGTTCGSPPDRRAPC